MKQKHVVFEKNAKYNFRNTNSWHGAQWVSRDMSDAPPPTANLKKYDYSQLVIISAGRIVEAELVACSSLVCRGSFSGRLSKLQELFVTVVVTPVQIALMYVSSTLLQVMLHFLTPCWYTKWDVWNMNELWT